MQQVLPWITSSKSSVIMIIEFLGFIHVKHSIELECHQITAYFAPSQLPAHLVYLAYCYNQV